MFNDSLTVNKNMISIKKKQKIISLKYAQKLCNTNALVIICNFSFVPFLFIYRKQH